MIERFAVKVSPSEGEATVKSGGSEYRITLADLEVSGITDGAEINDAALLFLSESEEKLRCIKKAFVYLSYKAHSVKAMAQKLKRCGFSEDAVEKTLFLLEKKGYLDDYALCAEYAAAIQKQKGYGVLRIKKELYAKGFNGDCIENAISGLDETPEGLVTEILRKKFPHLDPDDRQARAKATAYLAARGYDYEEINNAISAFKEE